MFYHIETIALDPDSASQQERRRVSEYFTHHPHALRGYLRRCCARNRFAQGIGIIRFADEEHNITSAEAGIYVEEVRRDLRTRPWAFQHGFNACIKKARFRQAEVMVNFAIEAGSMDNDQAEHHRDIITHCRRQFHHKMLRRERRMWWSTPSEVQHAEQHEAPGNREVEMRLNQSRIGGQQHSGRMTARSQSNTQGDEVQTGRATMGDSARNQSQ